MNHSWEGDYYSSWCQRCGMEIRRVVRLTEKGYRLVLELRVGTVGANENPGK